MVRDKQTWNSFILYRSPYNHLDHVLHAARILHATFVYFKVIFPSLGGPYVKRDGVFLEIVHKPDSVVLCTCDIVTILLLQLNKFLLLF